MKKYMLLLLILSGSMVLPIIGLDESCDYNALFFNKTAYISYKNHFFDTMQWPKNKNSRLPEFIKQYPALFRLYFYIQQNEELERHLAYKKKYGNPNEKPNFSSTTLNPVIDYLEKNLDTLVKAAKEDRNYLIVDEHDQSIQAPLSMLKNIQSLLTNMALFASSMSDSNTILNNITVLQKKTQVALNEIKKMEEQGTYKPNPEYHTNTKRFRYGLLITGGIAVGIITVIGICYAIKKHLLDTKKSNDQGATHNHSSQNNTSVSN